jgi:hypothetical protein
MDIIKARKLTGWTQAEFAERAGWSLKEQRRLESSTNCLTVLRGKYVGSVWDFLGGCRIIGRAVRS